MLTPLRSVRDLVDAIDGFPAEADEPKYQG